MTDKGMFEFIPFNNPTTSIDFKKQLQVDIPKMKRSRGWFDAGKQFGIRTLIGEKQAVQIEQQVSKGNQKIVEIGGGHLVTAKELAKLNSSNKLIAIEPFIDGKDLIDKPANLSVIAKGIEDVTVIEIPDGSIDVAFSGGETWNYIQDKLGCVQRIWQMLKVGGYGVVEFIGQPITPSIQQIIDRFKLNDFIHTEYVDKGHSIIVINKPAGKQLSFGKYTCTSSLSGNLPGDVNSYYEFH